MNLPSESSAPQQRTSCAAPSAHAAAEYSTAGTEGSVDAKQSLCDDTLYLQLYSYSIRLAHSGTIQLPTGLRYGTVQPYGNPHS
eukprot:7082357-Prymnesium_polylepis.1